jgi:hypothetical protein
MYESHDKPVLLTLNIVTENPKNHRFYSPFLL